MISGVSFVCDEQRALPLTSTSSSIGYRHDKSTTLGKLGKSKVSAWPPHEAHIKLSATSTSTIVSHLKVKNCKATLQGKALETPTFRRLYSAPEHDRFLLVEMSFELNLGNRLGKFPPRAERKRRLTCVGSRRAFGLVWSSVDVDILPKIRFSPGTAIPIRPRHSKPQNRQRRRGLS